MPSQIVLSWAVDVTNTVFGPAQAVAALEAVPLYKDATTDPVLGQLFGLTVASDETVAAGSAVTRTLTLNMNNQHAPLAPPPFPCRPRTSTPPVLPYPLRRAVTLPGSFFVSNGSMDVPTTETNVPSVSVGDSIQFLSQQGVFYEVASVDPTTIGITAPYTGVSGNTSAFKEMSAPVKLAAIYSTSELDTAGVTTVPAISPGAGARRVSLTYKDSTGAGPFTAITSLTGKRPAQVVLGFGSIDIAEIESMSFDSVGEFGNSVGQITLVELSSALPLLPSNLPIGTGIGATETAIGKVGAPVPRTFKTMTDEAQLLIDRSLAYMPPSFFALAQQELSAPQLEGDFLVSTGSKDVFTSIDQTGVLVAGYVMEFADQEGTLYTVATVSPKIVTLTTVYTGIDTNNTGLVNTGTNNNAGTMGNIGTKVIKKPTGATLLSPSPAAPPSDDQLATCMAQFVALETAQPPLNPPLIPSTVPVPTFLSGLFTRTLQLALAGVPIAPQAIAFV